MRVHLGSAVVRTRASQHPPCSRPALPRAGTPQRAAGACPVGRGSGEPTLAGQTRVRKGHGELQPQRGSLTPGFAPIVPTRALPSAHSAHKPEKPVIT